MAYVLAVEERERVTLLGRLGVEKNPRDDLDEFLGVKSWLLPGQQPRPVVVREPGVPDWWVDDAEASQSFLRSMGIQL